LHVLVAGSSLKIGASNHHSQNKNQIRTVSAESLWGRNAFKLRLNWRSWS
jgi:hypothetical protein